MVDRSADKVSPNIGTKTTCAVSYITFADITFLPVNASHNSTPFTTFREQAGLEDEYQPSDGENAAVEKLTVKFPGPGRTILIGEVEIRLEIE
jgi:hypothetical protein